MIIRGQVAIGELMIWNWMYSMYSMYGVCDVDEGQDLSYCKSQSYLDFLRIITGLVQHIVHLYKCKLCVLCVYRVVEGKAVFMCGLQGMVVVMTTAIVMATRPACGPSRLIRPLMMDERLCMTRAAPPHSPRRLATAARGTPRQEWWVGSCWVTVFGLICVSMCIFMPCCNQMQSMIDQHRMAIWRIWLWLLKWLWSRFKYQPWTPTHWNVQLVLPPGCQVYAEGWWV